MNPVMMIKKEQHWLAILALLTLMALLSPIPSVSAQTYRSCPPPYDAANYGSPLDLGQCNLSGANLSGANLSDAALFYANLSGANLSGADLNNAILFVANLSGADLTNANLYAADLRGADLSGADLSGADLSEAYLSEADLTNAVVNNVIWSNTTCIDETNSSAFTPERCDTTPPKISSSISGTKGSNGWFITDVEVSWSVSDPETTVTSMNGCDTTLINGDTAGMTLTCSATSGGGTGTKSVTIKRDATAPTASAIVSPAANANGWYNSDVTISFNGSDDLSGIASCAADVMLSNDGIDQSTSGTCTDKAGNVSAAATVEGINIDKTAPVVSITGVEDGASYPLGSVPTAACDTQDALSGVATNATISGSGSNPDGAGIFTAICEGASDNAGNSASASISYSVIYNFGGFTDPIDPQAINQVKAGQTVPVKFGLNGDQGLDIFAAGYPTSQEVACDGSASINAVEETDTAGNSGLSYDSDSDQYSYNWKSDKGWKGTCRQLIVRFDDGREYTALFQFK